MLYSDNDPKTRSDLWVLPVGENPKPALFLQTEFNEVDGTFSPDGKWIAYASDESGRHEIYVQPYPATGAKWQVSKSGGHWPRWRRDGKEMFFLEMDGTMMAVEVSAAGTFQAGIPTSLFETGIVSSGERYSVSRDGKRFLVPAPVEDTAASSPATLMWNWLK